ncbi:MAG: molybdopterin/thiamine biosynthesis adenylyltransferase [Bacteroidia bacterium]
MKSTRYIRQEQVLGFGPEGQAKIEAAKVLIIGCGGLGHPCAIYLVAAGIGKLSLCDGDVIEVSNLHRQILWNEADVGSKKDQVLQNRLMAQNSSVNIELAGKFNRQNAMQLIGNHDIICDCSDNFETRYLVNDACALLRKPLVYGAVNQFEGQLSVFNSIHSDGSLGPNLRDVFPNKPKDGEILNCEEAGVLGPVVGTIGTMMATEVIKYISGLGEVLTSKLLLLNAKHNTLNFIKLPKSSKHVITELEDNYSFNHLVNSMGWSEFWEKQKLDLSLTLIDVRTDEERVTLTMGGEHHPMNKMREFLDQNQTSNPVFYCASGIRAKAAAGMLAEERQVTTYYINEKLPQ